MNTTKLATSVRSAEAEADLAYPREGGAVRAVPKARAALSLRANFSWTFLGNAIDAAAWWATTVVLAKLGSPQSVGQLALGLAVSAPVFTFATLRLRDVQATDAKREFIFGDYFALRLTTTTLAFLAVAVIALASGYPLETALVVIGVALYKAIEGISDIYYGLFMQHEQLDRIAKSMIIKAPAFLLGLALGFRLTGSVFWGTVGLSIVPALVLVFYDRRNAILCLQSAAHPGSAALARDLPRPRWNRHTLTRLAWLALPLGFVSMLMSFGSNIPRYFVEGQLGSYQLGIFMAITAFQKTAPTVIHALGRSASPRLAKYYVANNDKAFLKLALGLFGVGAVLGTGGVLVALVAGRPILTLFYGPEYALSRVFVLVMVSAALDYIATMLLFVVTAARYFRVQLLLQLLMTATVAMACYWLVPSAGLEGAALAMALSDLVHAVGALAAAWHAQRAVHRRAVASPTSTRHGG